MLESLSHIVCVTKFVVEDITRCSNLYVNAQKKDKYNPKIHTTIIDEFQRKQLDSIG